MRAGPGIERIVARLAEGERRLSHFVVTYADGVQEHRGGTLPDAIQLAAEHELKLVPTVGGWFHWVRDHETWWWNT